MARRALKAGVAAVAITASFGATTGSASAGAFALREQSAYGQGASFAGMAAPGDSISSMYWNPAAVTTAVGLVFEGHHTFISPHADFDPDSGTSPALTALVPGDGGDLGIDAYLPATYVAYQVNDSLYLGLSINTPYGLATHAETPWVGQLDHISAKVKSVDVTPTIGYRINEQWSVGLGAQIQWFDVNIRRATSLTASPSVADLSGDDFGFGLTAGVTYQPFEGTTIGLGYRSPIKHSLDGDLEALGATTPIGADLTLPETVSLGIRQKVNEQFTLLGGVEWQNWSRLGTVDVTTGSGATATQLEFEYGDGWFFSLGGEYQFNDQLTLRTGLAYELSPVRDEFRSARLPDADRLWLSAGLSYTVNDRLSLDAAYTHIFGNEADISQTNATTGLTYSGSSESSVDILSVSLRYKLGG